jgi:hypothetical protein
VGEMFWARIPWVGGWVVVGGGERGREREGGEGGLGVPVVLSTQQRTQVASGGWRVEGRSEGALDASNQRICSRLATSV